MEASSARKRFGGNSPRDLLSTRRGSLMLAAAAALLAAILLFVFIDSRDDGGGSGSSSNVLVAKSLIPKGSGGDVVAAQGLTAPTSFKGSDVKDGAITDPASLRGKVATADIYPGQQITAGDFVSGDEGLTQKLAGSERAISVPVDSAHGLIGQINDGDRVDVLVGFNNAGSAGTSRPVIKTLLQDVLVLDAPAGGEGIGGGGSSNVVLRARDTDAAALAFAADNGKVWIMLRPPAGAKATRPSTVSLQSLLASSKPISGGE